MGRLPAQFAGKDITFRIPYSMPGELVIANGLTGQVFPEATFLHNVDKPFEIHRVIIRITPFDNQGTPVVVQPQFLANTFFITNVLEKYVRVRIRDTSKNESFTKNAQLVDGLVKGNERTWEWDEPYSLVRSEGFEIQVDNVAPTTFTLSVCGCAQSTSTATQTVTIANLRVEITFEGFLLIIAPASESR